VDSGGDALIAVGVRLAAPEVASAASTVVDTRDDATTTFISSFGVPNTTTYGQLITARPGRRS
jgi:hypothetical protein